MKRSKYSESQIVSILKEAESGVPLENLIRHRFSKATFYKWKAKYSGISVSALKELEEENQRLKQMYANLSLEHTAVKASLNWRIGWFRRSKSRNRNTLPRAGLLP